MRTVVGCDTGIIKVLENESIVARFGTPIKGNTIDYLSWIYPDSINLPLDIKERNVLISLRNGNSSVREGKNSTESEILSWNWRENRVLFKVLRKGIIVGLETLSIAESENSVKIVSCNSIGNLQIIECMQNVDRIENENNANMQSKELERTEEILTDLDLKGQISKMRLCPFPSSSLVAIGGHKTDLALWDFDTKKLIWKAKNVRHDELGLESPISITDLRFIGNGERPMIVVSTAYHQV